MEAILKLAHKLLNDELLENIIYHHDCAVIAFKDGRQFVVTEKLTVLNDLIFDELIELGKKKND